MPGTTHPRTTHPRMRRQSGRTRLAATANAAGAGPIVTVNYGAGIPALAAARVQDADVTNSDLDCAIVHYGDEGIFSNDSSGSGYTEPAAETPFSPYYGIEMLAKLGSPGDELVDATSNTGSDPAPAGLSLNGTVCSDD